MKCSGVCVCVVEVIVMELERCTDDADHCTYMYDSLHNDCADSVAERDVIIAAVDFDELQSICAADCESLSPSHHPCMLFDASGQIQPDDTDSPTCSVVIEEEVNGHSELFVNSTNSASVVIDGQVNGHSELFVNSTDSRQLDSASVVIDGQVNEHSELFVNSTESGHSSAAVNTCIDYTQNAVLFCCYLCARKFTRLQVLKGHMKRQHSSVCDVSRVTQETLPTAAVCRLCGYVGTSQQVTNVHVTRKHCHQAAEYKTNARRLMLNRQRMAATKAAYPAIVCLICASEIGLLKNYDAHIKRYHQNDSRFAEALEDVRRIQFERTRSRDGIVLNCETCGELCDEKRLVAHIRWKHSSNVNIQQLVTAARQLIRSSKQQRTATRRASLVSCPHCGRRLRQISLANHVKFYCIASEPSDSVRPTARCHVQCTICGESMPQPKLPRHRRLVHQIGTYKQIEKFECEYCPREFTEAHQLQTHLKKHTGIVQSRLLVCTLYILLVCTYWWCVSKCKCKSHLFQLRPLQVDRGHMTIDK